MKEWFSGSESNVHETRSCGFGGEIWGVNRVLVKEEISNELLPD